MTTKISIEGTSGNIAGILQLPELNNTNSCPMALILHGIYDDKETPFIKSIAERLLNEGIGSLRIDFDGHGESDGDFLDMTIPKEIDDAYKALKYLKSLETTSTITVIGHSQGGVVAGILAGIENEITIDSLILLAPGASLKDDCLKGEIFGSKFDPINIPEIVENPWGPLGRQYLLENQKMEFYEETAKYKGAVCLIHGTSDDIVPIYYADKFLEYLPLTCYHRLDGLDHYFEPRQKDVLDIITTFLHAS